VRAVRDERARLHELLPDVRSLFGARRSQARQHVRRVGGAVNPLHRRDDAQTAETRDVLRAEVLRVLDAPPELAAVALGVALERRLVDVQRFAVAAIADG